MDSRLEEEFLTCIVCHEVFRDPVTLHCGHTFCTECVTAYTKTQHQAIARQCIPCPHCRAFTKAVNPQQSVEQWARQMKTGFFVKGLVDAFVANKHEVKLCTPCTEDGEETKASVWCTECRKALCTDCRKFHRRLMPSHSVSDLGDMKTSDVETADKKILCEDHKNTVVDMLCQKCEVAVCPKCCIEKHKACMDSVVTLHNALPQITSVLKKQEKALEDDIAVMEKEIPILESQMKKLQMGSKKTETDIESFSLKVATALASSLKNKLWDLKKDALSNIQNNIVNTKERLQMAQQSQRLVNEVLKSPSEIARYEVYKSCPREVRNQFIQKAPPRILKFMLDETIDSENMEGLGKITPIFDECHLIAGMSMAVLVDSVLATLESDTETAYLNDIIVMEINNKKVIVVSDKHNSRIKSFYKLGSRLCSSSFPAEKPRSLTTITNTKAAVAVPDSNQIVTFSITPDVVEDKRIETQKRYYDLCYLASAEFVALAFLDGDVDIINMSGTVLRTLCPGAFTKPGRVIQKDSHTLLVTDVSQRLVKAITNQGDAKFVFRDHLSFPRGLGRNTMGEYFIVEQTSTKVIQFSSSGEFVREVLTAGNGLEKPTGLFVDKDNTMYVATETGYIQKFVFM